MEAVTDIMNQVQNQLSGEDIRIKMRNKVINGGTVTKAKLGYLNIRKDVEGRMINTVGLDEKRAPLVLKAFELYSTGKYSIERIEATMADLGLTTRRTARYPEQPVSASKLHALLKDPYYVGYLVYKGDIYPGCHEPIVGQDLFDQVQDVMRARSGAGTRDRVHHHCLKGMLFCGKCQAAGRQSRIIYTQANGRGGTTYEDFFCRARQERACDLSYIPAQIVEDRVIDTYGGLQLDPDFEADLRARLEAAMKVEQGESKAMRSSLAKQLREIELKESHLIDLAAEGLLDASKIRRKVHELAVLKSRVEDTLANIESKIALGAELLSKALDQLSDPRSYYVAAPDKVWRLLNESFYQQFFVSEDGGVVVN